MIAVLLTAAICRAEYPLTPRIVGEWWTVAGDPDLGPLTNPKQQPVDFGIWQAADGTWQLWSCIRGTKEPGKTRLFHRWEGASSPTATGSPRASPCRPTRRSAKRRAACRRPTSSATTASIWMFYGDWVNICLATSTDGKTFTRHRNADGKPQLNFSEPGGTRPQRPRPDGPAHRRQVALLLHRAPRNKGATTPRTSDDLLHWGPEPHRGRGRRSGDGPVLGRVPLRRRAATGPLLSLPHAAVWEERADMVYHSRDPLDFGIEHDAAHYVTTLPVAAPEIFQHEGRWYMAALLPT